jgi:hypothetical protein
MKLKHFTSLQYATTAAIVLVAAVQFSNIPAERQPLLGNLQSITDSLSELAVTFEPAKALAASLHTLLQKDEVNVAALLNFDSGFRDHIFMSSITSEMFGQSVPPLCDHEPLEEWALTSATHADIAARSSSSAFDGDIFTNDFLSPIGSLEANAGAGSTNSLEDRSESWY